MTENKNTSVDKLLDIMARLRDPEKGCPWDCRQTAESISGYTLEEAYEVYDAVAAGDMDALREELGDLLFHIVFYARIAEEQGSFSFSGIVQAACDKMIRRHPHVFGDVKVDSIEDQLKLWEEIKAQEKNK